MYRTLWSYRHFILGSVKREFQSRYRRSLLGAAWSVLNPLAMIVVYTLIFSGIMKARLPGVDSTFAYSIYLCAGILTWGLFAEIVNRGQNVFIENANLLKKLNFPRICLPIIVVISALINFSIIFSLFVIFLLVTGNFPGAVFLALAPVLLIQIVLAIGLGILLGVLNVFFRDVGQMVGVLLLVWFWLTPIVYPLSIIPHWAQAYLAWNPMASLVMSYQTVLVNHQWPDWSSLMVVTAVAVFLAASGLQLYRKHVHDMVDEL